MMNSSPMVSSTGRCIRKNTPFPPSKSSRMSLPLDHRITASRGWQKISPSSEIEPMRPSMAFSSETS